MVRRIDNSRCVTPPTCERRVFWSTQIDACPPVEVCDQPCAVPGLRLVPVRDECAADGLGCFDSTCPNDAVDEIGTTIDTSNYVVGLALNILLTDARRDDTECGWLPGRRGGHWSETFIGGSAQTGSSARVGSRVRFHSGRGSIQEQVNEIEAYAQDDLAKLVTYGVASKVDVEAKYVGRGSVAVQATIYGSAGEVLGRVGVKGQRAANGWVWST